MIWDEADDDEWKETGKHRPSPMLESIELMSNRAREKERSFGVEHDDEDTPKTRFEQLTCQRSNASKTKQFS